MLSTCCGPRPFFNRRSAAKSEPFPRRSTIQAALDLKESSASGGRVQMSPPSRAHASPHAPCRRARRGGADLPGSLAVLFPPGLLRPRFRLYLPGWTGHRVVGASPTCLSLRVLTCCDCTDENSCVAVFVEAVAGCSLPSVGLGGCRGDRGGHKLGNSFCQEEASGTRRRQRRLVNSTRPSCPGRHEPPSVPQQASPGSGALPLAQRRSFDACLQMCCAHERHHVWTTAIV
mmetsp:Transcript_79856/g.211561  ORF Transcript_79856/g.211561 Transcript_79856/m.211561 type:complete len:231 (+) Transcript_79856:362-1054(+)